MTSILLSVFFYTPSLSCFRPPCRPFLGDAPLRLSVKCSLDLLFFPRVSAPKVTSQQTDPEGEKGPPARKRWCSSI